MIASSLNYIVYEREVSVMSRASSLKAEEKWINTFFSKIPVRLYGSRTNDRICF